MRTKTLFLIVIIVLIATFAVLNVDEFTRVATLNFGFTTMQLPLGLVMLMLVAALLLIFLVTTLYMHNMNLMETRKYAKELTVQRELAEKAEVSRFTELRRYLESQAALAMNQGSDTIAASVGTLSDTATKTWTSIIIDNFPPTADAGGPYAGNEG